MLKRTKHKIWVYFSIGNTNTKTISEIKKKQQQTAHDVHLYTTLFDRIVFFQLHHKNKLGENWEH